MSAENQKPPATSKTRGIPRVYRFDSRHYQIRARRLLDKKSPEALFHAAFELRAGIEARMQEYLSAHEHVPKRHARQWRISKLGGNIERAFRMGDKIASFTVYDENTGLKLTTLYYTPVTSKLRKMGERLGDYLHAIRKRPTDKWWNQTRAYLEAVYRELETSNTGTLLGPPLRLRGSSGFTTSVELPEGEESALIRQLFAPGAKRKLKIDYLDELPSELLKARTPRSRSRLRPRET